MQHRLTRGLSDQTAGILIYVLAIITMSTMDMIAKTLSGHVPVLMAVWARYAGQTVVVTLYLLPRLRSVVRTRYPMLQFLRSAFLLTGTSLFFLAISRLGLAEATALMDLNPVFITLGAALILGERFGVHRGLGIGAAVIGALIILRPGMGVFSPYALLPIAAALGYAGFVLVTRFIGRDESTWTSMFYSALLGSLVLSVAVIPVWQTPDPFAIFLMAIIGLIGALGQFLLTRAFTLAEASVAAPFSYLGLIAAAFWGWVVFGAVPDAATWIGAGIIVASGIYIWHRETQAARAARPSFDA